MAHIFKQPTNTNKGIIVFTHKEWPWLFQNAVELIQGLKQHFFLGWNQGIFFGNIGQMSPLVDFTFASPSALDYQDNGHTLKIELMDRNFLTDDYKDLGIAHKHYDIICISRVVKWKNVPALLKALRKLYDKNKKYKTLLIIPKPENETVEHFDTDIVKQYEEMFDYEERKNITLLRLSSELGFLGMSPQTINRLYNNSKVLYIGSKSEGGCRVTHEALLCGCDIVYYKQHQGPMVDYLNASNSIPFDDYDSIDIALERAVSSYSYTKTRINKYEKLLSERYAKEKLIPHFNKLYEKHNMKFDGQLINCDNLSNRLPAHYLDVPWNHPTEPTADIKSNEQLNKFITYINNENNR